MRHSFVFVVFALIASPVAAQERLMLNGMPLRDALAQPVMADQAVGAIKESAAAKAPVADTSFWLVGGLLGGSTVADLKTTFSALDRCSNCREGNPVMAPLVNAGPAVTYGVQAAVDVAVMAWSARLKAQHSKIWWLMPVVMSATHSIAAISNSRH